MKVVSYGEGGTLRLQASNLHARFEVTAGGIGVVGHPRVVLLVELADRLELPSVFVMACRPRCRRGTASKLGGR
jgi:hypothetical protein